MLHVTGFVSRCSEDPFQVLLDIFSFISLDAILSSINTINCVTRVTPELEYLFLDGGFKDNEHPSSHNHGSVKKWVYLQ